MKMLIDFLHNETGATAIEYGLIVAIMCIGVTSGVSSYGANLIGLYDFIYAAVAGAQ